MKNLFKELVQFGAVFFGVVHGPNQQEREAISELMAYSDRELADLGISRSAIIDAVLYGRPLDKKADEKSAVLDA